MESTAPLFSWLAQSISVCVAPGPCGLLPFCSFPMAGVSASTAPSRMRNEKVNWICKGSLCLTIGKGKKKGRENYYWPFSITRVRAGKEGSQDVSLIYWDRGWGRLKAGAGARLHVDSQVIFTSVLPCQCPQRVLPALTEPNHMRWSQIKLPGDFFGLHRWSVEGSQTVPWSPQTSNQLDIQRQKGQGSLDAAAVVKARSLEP